MDKEISQKLKEYYKSPYWKGFVKKILEPDDTECEICGCKRWKFDKKGNKKVNRIFNIHHKHYRNLNHERRDNVMVLCRRCHNLFHDILRIASDYQAIKELKEVVNKHFDYER